MGSGITCSCLWHLAKVSEEVSGLWTKRAKRLNCDLLITIIIIISY